MVTSEAESRKVDATSRSVVWFETLKSSIKKVKELYPEITLDVKMRYPAESEVSEDGDSNSEPDRAV